MVDQTLTKFIGQIFTKECNIGLSMLLIMSRQMIAKVGATYLHDARGGNLIIIFV